MRSLIATVLENNKGKKIYCAARKVNEQQIDIIRHTEKELLEERGFTFIRMISLEFPNVRGYAIFFEGHIDHMARVLKEFG